MEERNLDFEIPVTLAQWDQLGRTAARLGPGDGGFDWREREPDRIHVFMRNADAPDGWRDFVGSAGRYGEPEREVAQFVFNDGRPYAEVRSAPQVEPPNFSQAQEREMDVEMERFVRGKWESLMKESGLHYDPGHLDYSRPPPL